MGIDLLPWIVNILGLVSLTAIDTLTGIWEVTEKINCLPLSAVAYFTMNLLTLFSSKRIICWTKGTNSIGGSGKKLVANILRMY